MTPEPEGSLGISRLRVIYLKDSFFSEENITSAFFEILQLN